MFTLFSGQGDYDALSEVTVMFTVGTAPDSVQRQIFITINEDSLVEPDEIFRVTFEPVATSQGDTANFMIGSINETNITILDSTPSEFQ